MLVLFLFYELPLDINKGQLEYAPQLGLFPHFGTHGLMLFYGILSALCTENKPANNMQNLQMVASRVHHGRKITAVWKGSKVFQGA